MMRLLIHALFLSGSLSISLTLLVASSMKMPTQTDQTMRLQEATNRPFWQMKPHPMAPFLWGGSLPFTGMTLYQAWKICGLLLEGEEESDSGYRGGADTASLLPAFTGGDWLREGGESPHEQGSHPSNPALYQEQRGLPLGVPMPPRYLVKPQGTFAERREALWQLLQKRERTWIAKCLQAPVLIWGPQGSKKTVFASYLLLLRMILLGHRCEVCDPHYHLNTDKWAPFIPAFGAHRNYRAIAERMQAYYSRIDAATLDKAPYSVVWDEVTQYEDHLKSFGGSQAFLKSVCSDTRKSREYPILISHDDTLSVLAGSKGGVHKMKMQGLVSLFLGARRDAIGEPVPTNRGVIRGLDCQTPSAISEFPVVLEDWMSPTFLLELFPELRGEYSLGSERGAQSVADVPLEAQFQDEVRQQGIELTAPLRAILDYFYKHPERGLKVRDIQMATLPVLQEHHMKSAEIQLCLETLVNEGFLLFDSESNTFSLRGQR